MRVRGPVRPRRSSGSSTMASRCSTRRGCPPRRSCSAAATGPPWWTRSGASRSGAPRRSGWPARWAWPWRRCGPPGTEREGPGAEVARAAAGLRTARPTAVNLAWAVDAQARRAAAHRGIAGRARGVLAAAARALHAAEVDRCVRMGAHGAEPARAGRRDPHHLQHRRAGHGRLRHGARRGAGGPRGRPHDAHAGLRDPPAAPGLAADGLGAGAGGHPLHADRRRDGGRDDGRAARSPTSSWAPTASPPTATWSTRSAPTPWRCWPASTACPFLAAAPTRTLDPSTPSGADVPMEERSAEEVRGLSLFGRPAAPRGRRRGQPGLRPHARAPRGGDRHRAGRAPAAVRALAGGGGRGGRDRGRRARRDAPLTPARLPRAPGGRRLPRVSAIRLLDLDPAPRLRRVRAARAARPARVPGRPASPLPAPWCEGCGAPGPGAGRAMPGLPRAGRGRAPGGGLRGPAQRRSSRR